jgi:16S rRNA (cytidine1402-2'-O)-methyltransferase
MPGISDPGYELIQEAVKQGVTVVPLPGPSAITTAVAISGLPADQFVYLGFLPRRQGQRKRLLESVAAEPRTMVAFEAPHRLREALGDILETLGDRRIAVCRELTKVHEELFRGTVREAIAHFAAPRGEFTLVIAGAESPPARDDADIDAALKRERRRGQGARQAVAALAEATGVPKRQLYERWLRLK